MINKTLSFAEYDPPVPDGEFVVKNRQGKNVKIDGEKLIEGTDNTRRYIPLDDPDYQEYFKSKLDLLKRIEKKYSGKGHEALKQEIGILRCKNQNLLNGVGYDYSPGYKIIVGINGLEKFQDVLYNVENEAKNGSDKRMDWTMKDSALVERTVKEFGVVDIQRKYKEINEHNAEWAKEWLQEDRDLNKLYEIGDKFKKDIMELDVYIKKFEEKYQEDMKLPEEKRKIYNITTHDDVMKHELIIDPEHGGRGINGRNWEEHKEQFLEEYERQIITAELGVLMKDKSIKLPSGLKKQVDSYIRVTNESFDKDERNKEYKGNGFESKSITGIRRLMDVRAEAEKTPDNKGAQMIIELADRHLKDPANAKLVEKANAINAKYAEMGKKVTSFSDEVKRDGLDNGDRLKNIYNQRKLGGTGTLRFYRGSIGVMQYFNKDSDDVVLNGMRTLMNDAEKSPLETKKKMVREIEKFFKSVMEFDNKKCEFRSYEELWIDPKHKDLSIMGCLAAESEPILKQYKLLMKDAMTAAITALRDTNAFMNDRYTEVTRKVLVEENKAKTAYEDEQVADFRQDMGKNPSYMKYAIKGASEALDKLAEISSGNNDVPLTPEELKDAKKAMDALTIYTTIQHGRKNDKGFEIPLSDDRVAPMIENMMNRPAFQKVIADINTREQIRNVMVDPDKLRERYTVADVAEKLAKKENANRQLGRRGQPVQEKDRQKQNGQDANNNDQPNRQKGGLKGPNN